MKLISAFLCLCVAMTAVARNTATAVFHPDFKSLQVIDSTNQLGQPIIHRGNDGSQLTFSFDELSDEYRYLRYRLVHCNSNWQPSEISDLEYVDGFNEGEIDTFDYSNNTFMHYVHYSFSLPNEQMTPLLSGNYLVEVYDQDEPETTLLQARFMVSEDLAGMSLKATSRTDIDYNNKHQQLSVAVNLDGIQVDDPFNELRLVIIQNGREADRHVIEKPLRVNAKNVIYEHQRELIFSGGNEYRRFSTANVRYPGMGVEQIYYIDPLYNVKLVDDEPRQYERYLYDQDQAGRYFVDEIYSSDPDLEADYVITYFTLKMPEIDQDVFIDGDLTLRQRNADAQMFYDKNLGAYVKTMLLKQGLYNYQYVSADGDTSLIEGDHYETVNEYVALLYYRPYSARYERLIGVGLINSGQ